MRPSLFFSAAFPALCVLFCATSAITGPSYYDSYNQTIYDQDDASLGRLSSRQGRVPLRIMPLGASVTAGQGDLPENGYRKPLRDQLRYLGHEVNMIGCAVDGDFNDRQHEGHRGARVRDMRGFAACSIGQKPNLILILVGSNDASTATDDSFVGPVVTEMRALIAWLFQESAGVTIVLATLTPNATPEVDRRIWQLNIQYRALVREFKAQGNRIQLAEMHNGFITEYDLKANDPTHPSPSGYRKLAAVWASAIQAIEPVIQTPIVTGTPDKGTGVCEPSPDKFRGPVLTQRGSGWEDGTYIHKETYIGAVVVDYAVDSLGDLAAHYHFAQLVNCGGADRGGEADDLVRVLDPDQKPSSRVSLRVNCRFDRDDWVPIDVKIDCLNKGVRWGDFNNDGLDDFICLSPEGHMSVSINLGGDPPQFRSIGMVRAAEGWITQASIRLGDIDGDGRLDYCAVQSNGDMYCWRNGGQGDAPAYWQEMAGSGPTFNTKGYGDIAGVRLVDINGDFKADYVYVFADGATKIWINQRGTAADGPGLKPAWIESQTSHGPGVDLDRDHLKFARIYGSGRADHIQIKTLRIPITNTRIHFFEVSRNEGIGGKNLRGDGVHYCDMYGRGHDDYIWVWSDGKIVVFENIDNPPFWDPHEGVLDTQRPRKGIHFADWNGDGRCDVLAVDKATGRVDMWRNTYTSGAIPTFSYEGQVVPAGLCSEGWGVGLYDLGIRFADIDGDGRADYLCIEKDGRTTAGLNKPAGIQWVNRIKGTQGLDRANHRFVDVNGDGRADFVWQDKITGDVIAWINNGMIPSSGSSFNWAIRENFWKKGMDRGANLYFAKMSKSDKLDYVQNLPKTNVAYTWYNECPGSGGAVDDGPIVFPNLPSAPPLRDELLDGYRAAMEAYMTTTTCPNPGAILNPGDQLKMRQLDGPAQYSSHGLLFMILTRYLGNADEMLQLESVWDEFMGGEFPYLRTESVRRFARTEPDYDFPSGPAQVSHDITCNPYYANLRASGGNSRVLNCSIPICSEETCDDLEGELVDTRRRGLLKRVGGVRDYPVGLVGPNGERFSFTITLDSYPQVRDLAVDAPELDHAVHFRDDDNCEDTHVARYVIPPVGDPEFDPMIEMEHLFDGVVMARFMRDAAAGVLRSGTIARAGPISMSFFRVARTMPLDLVVAPPALPGGFADNRIYPRVMECLGSLRNDGFFVPTTKDINKVKGALMQGQHPIAFNRFPGLAQDLENPHYVLRRTRASIAMIRYLHTQGEPDLPQINQRLADIVNNVDAQWLHAQTVYNNLNPTAQVDISRFWREWINDFYPWLLRHTVAFVQACLTEMRNVWDTRTGADARQAQRIIRSQEGQLAALRINTARFNQPPP